MKKLVFLLLLTFLPLQSIWASAAVYCNHEKIPVAKHFGHHDHQHQAKEDAGTKQGKLPKVDNDCSTCHFSSLASLPVMQVAVDMRIVSDHPASAPLRYSSHIPDGPTRPDRRLLA